MKRLTILTFILVVMLGLVSCGQDDAGGNNNSTSSTYFNNQWTGHDPLFGNGQCYDLECRYNTLKQQLLNKSLTDGLEPFDYVTHEVGTYSTTYFSFGNTNYVKKAVDSLNGTSSVAYTEFDGYPVIDPNSATQSVFDATDRQALVDEVFSRSHTKVLTNIQTISYPVNGRTYPMYKITYMEYNPAGGYLVQAKISTYVICLDIPLMANPVLKEEKVPGGEYKLLREIDFDQFN